MFLEPRLLPRNLTINISETRRKNGMNGKICSLALQIIIILWNHTSGYDWRYELQMRDYNTVLKMFNKT